MFARRTRKTSVAVVAVSALLAAGVGSAAAPADARADTADNTIRLSSAAGVTATAQTAAGQALGALVAERALAKSGTVAGTASARLAGLSSQGRSLQVRTDRQAGSWVQGVAYIEAPAVQGATPEGWVFFAQRSGAGWRVALEGDRGFGQLAAKASTGSAAERATYRQLAAPQQAKAAADTGMQFPMKAGSWFWMGSPHGHTGYSGPLSSIDLSGSDGTVRSTRGGNAINMCNGWTRIIHNNGYSTDYYHLAWSRQLSGAVGQNVVLGNQGTTICAGGAAYGAHVHFSLREYDANLNGWYVSLNGKIIGKHRITTGGYYTGGSTVDVTNGNSGGLPGSRWNY